MQPAHCRQKASARQRGESEFRELTTSVMGDHKWREFLLNLAIVLQSLSAAAPKIILHLIVIAREIKSQDALFRVENEPPRKPRATFVQMLPQLPDSQPRMCVRSAESRQHEPQCCGHFRLAPGIPHDLFEPLGQFNGNHSCFR
jgi:hypothetical protein